MQPITTELLPPIPVGLSAECRTRGLAGEGALAGKWLPYLCGGFFRPESGDMAWLSLAKICAITIDVDFHLFPPALAYAVENSDLEPKKYYREMSNDARFALMGTLGFAQAAFSTAHRSGLPATPNRVICTGHGLALIYWLGDDIGNAAGQNTANLDVAAVRAAVRGQSALISASDESWWWDAKAKDAGTRLFPQPGHSHRCGNGAPVVLLAGHDRIADLSGWLTSGFSHAGTASTAHTGPGGPERAGGSRTAGKAEVQAASEAWTDRVLADWIDLEVGGRTTCPLCGGSGLRRMGQERRLTCYSCYSHFFPSPVRVRRPIFDFELESFESAPSAPKHEAPVQAEPTVENTAQSRPFAEFEVVHCELDERGHARFPQVLAEGVINACRTGSGKTHLLNNIVTKHEESGGVAIVISPTIALAESLARVLHIAHASARSGVTYRQSHVSCLAGLCSSAAAPFRSMGNILLAADELETSLQQIETLGQVDQQTYSLLVFLFAAAQRTYISDAHAGPRIAQFLVDVATLRATLCFSARAWTILQSAPHRYRLLQVAATRGETAAARHIALICDQVANNKRLTVHVDSKARALALAATLRRRFPAKTITCVTSTDAKEDRVDLSAENLVVDVLIYTSAMSTGVSIDAVGHYDCRHAIIVCPQISDGPSVEQALHRVRSPKTDDIYISLPEDREVPDAAKDPHQVLAAAVRRHEHGVTAWQPQLNLKFELRGSPEYARYVFAQATSQAAAASAGRGALQAWLRARHDVVEVDGMSARVIRAEITAEVRRADAEIAATIAAAVAATEQVVEKVRAVGADTQEEYIGATVARLDSYYGEAYSQADELARAAIAHADRKRGLAEQTAVLAATLMVSQGLSDLVHMADFRRNARKTVMSENFRAPRARTVSAVLERICALPQADGKIAVSEADALHMLGASLRTFRTAGLPLDRAWRAAPFRALNTILGRAGLKLVSVRLFAGGIETRAYHLDIAALQHAATLAAATVARWTAKEAEPSDQQ